LKKNKGPGYKTSKYGTRFVIYSERALAVIGFTDLVTPVRD